MALTDSPEPEIHPVALLLPWYVNGTLSPDERLQADEHLATCSSCRAELAEARVMGRQVREASAWPPVQVDQLHTAQSRLRAARRKPLPGRMGSVAPRWRRLFAPTWLPATAVVLLIAQSAALIWVIQRAPVAGQVAPRGLPSPVTRLRMSFRPTSTEQELRQLLLASHARLVAGPTATGVYLVEIPTTDSVRVDQTLAQLRRHTDLVQSAERAP